MPAVTLLALVGCGLAITIGLAMSFLVLWQAPRARENQLMVAYFLASSYGSGANFLARTLSLVGADVSPYLYEYYDGSSLAFVALLSLTTYYAGLWRYRWVPWLLAAAVVWVLAVQLPLMHQGQVIRVAGYDATGDLEMSVAPLGQVFLAAMSPMGLLVIFVALRHERSRRLLPGLVVAVAGPLVHSLVPALRPFPVAAVSAAVASVLLARCILVEKLFDPMAQLNREMQSEIRERGMLIGELRAFADTVAHDLKGPLGPILGSAQILEEAGDGLSASERAGYARLIGRNAATMVRIIDSLLLLAKLRHWEVAIEAVDMQKVVADVRLRLAPQITSYGGVIDEPRQWPVALGYAPWIEEIWANFLSNALKYGGRPPRIQLEARRVGEVCEFAICDNGDGLSADERRQLFQPLTRLWSSGDDGHGLGLWIVQRIVERLGGTVGVESDGAPGRGCRFLFTLPAAQTADAALEPVRVATLARSAEARPALAIDRG
jgi:signal transduction histidine kinase